jgi:hypothetical protein
MLGDAVGAPLAAAGILAGRGGEKRASGFHSRPERLARRRYLTANWVLPNMFSRSASVIGP